MSKLLATTLNGQMMLGKYHADIPGLKDGTILDSEDCDLVWQIYHQGKEIWLDINHDSFRDLTPLGYKTRQAYILKSQPKKDPIGGYAPGNYYCKCLDCKVQFQGDKRASQCEPCAIKSSSQPSLNEGSTNSEIGSYHWFHTLMGKQKRIGEYLMSKTPDESILREWAKSLYETSDELINGYHRINNKDLL